MDLSRRVSSRSAWIAKASAAFQLQRRQRAGGRKSVALVFSFFEDTVKWVQDFLNDELGRRAELSHYRGRMVAVSGSGELAEVSRQQAVQGFAPISMEAPAGEDADRYDLLISTDVLAEVVNLQQCRHIINFDMPATGCSARANRPLT